MFMLEKSACLCRQTFSRQIDQNYLQTNQMNIFKMPIEQH